MALAAVRCVRSAVARWRDGEGGAEETTGGAVVVWRQCVAMRVLGDGICGARLWRAL